MNFMITKISTWIPDDICPQLTNLRSTIRKVFSQIWRNILKTRIVPLQITVVWEFARILPVILSFGFDLFYSYMYDYN
jgi:hypothetical protein